jgi:multiple sugar transport system ATP-binding protein
MFVAGFIGSPSMNFTRGTLVKDDDLMFNSKNFKLTIDKTLSKTIDIDKQRDVVLGIRPEHISADPGFKDKWPGLSVEVEVIEPMGNESYMYCRTGGQSFILRGPVSPHIKVGDTVPVYFNLEHIHFFDPDTEQSLTAH